MRSSVLAWSRARVRARGALASGAALLAFTALLLSGCAAAGNSTVTVSGKSLTIYVSQPPNSTGDTSVQDVLDAEQLAFSQKQAEVAGFRLRLVTLRGAKLSDNARTAISDLQAIAYMGEIRPGDSADTIGITNAQDLLQVSPADTAAELTQSTPAVPGAPGRYYESLKTYGRTFARVVPTSAAEAKVQVQQMQTLGVKRLYVSNDGSHYGAALAAALRNDASAAAISLVPAVSAADAAFYAGADAVAAARAFTRLTQANATLKLFGPSALDTPAFSAGLAAGRFNVNISSPGFLAKDLPPLGRKFETDFRSSYGHRPAPQAIFGYEAMAAVLDVLRQAGTQANNRSTVVKDFFSIRNRDSVLGGYSINSAGDTSIAPFVFSRLRDGVLTPFKALPAQG